MNLRSRLILYNQHFFIYSNIPFMTDPTPVPEDILKKLSRRQLLRNSAITATGAVLLPSFLTGCHKDVYDIIRKHVPGAGVGGVELTPAELENAANNLKTLRSLLIEVYDLAAQYDDAVFHTLNSTKTDSWAHFAANLMIDIAAALLSAVAIAAEGPAAIPAIAFLSAVLHDWGIGNHPPSTLEAAFAEFEFGRVAMIDAIEDKLSSLVDPTDNYSTLRAEWSDPISFNGTTYTLGDLASQQFTLGVEYNKLHDAAFTSMKKSLWNLLIMKCCTYYKNWPKPFGAAKGALTEWAQTKFYSYYKGSYMRARLVDTDPALNWNYYELIHWDLGINGYPFPDQASEILFKDDTPGHIIRPDALFNRSYVFQQFSITKPDFTDGHELADTPDRDFADSDEFNFTGGLFPNLTH
jgi:hypothetical protein